MGDEETVHVRVSPELKARLEVEAEARFMSTSRLCHFLLREGIEALIPADELKLTRDEPSPAQG